MRQQVIIGNATLYCGDCRELLPSIGRVDSVVTDPPYNAEAHGANRILGKGRKREMRERALDFNALTSDQQDFVSVWAAKNCNGWMLAFCQAEAVASWRDSMEAAGQKWRRAMVWVKPDSSPQLTGDRPAQGYESIAASWCGEGRSVWNGGGRRGVFVVCKHDRGNGHGDRSNEHPTQKPVALMDDLVHLFSQRGAIVCDPFMGSGTTGVSCLRTDRNFIGIEKDPRYFEMACRRIEAAHAQMRLFA